MVQQPRSAGRFHWHDGGNGVYSAQWNDFPEQGELLFAAGTGRNATKSMSILVNHLHGGRHRGTRD